MEKCSICPNKTITKFGWKCLYSGQLCKNIYSDDQCRLVQRSP